MAEEASARVPLDLATGGIGKGSTKFARVLTLSVLGCVGMACIMAEATLDPSSNILPANMEDCRKKFRREVNVGLSQQVRDDKAAMDAGGAASIAGLTRGYRVSQSSPTDGHNLYL